MKNVVIYANCQGEALRRIFSDTSEFIERYIAYHITNYVYIGSGRLVTGDRHDRELVAGADVFIYQPLSDVYGDNSTSHILSLLKPGCVRLSIPFVFNISLWPFIMALGGDIWTGADDRYDQEPVIKYIDPIDNLIQEGISRDAILAMFDNNEIDWRYKLRHDVIIALLRAKEQDADIKVVDFIERNLKKKRMFVFCSHPSSELLIHMVNQIYSRLDLSNIENKYSDNYFIPNLFVKFPTSAVEHFGMEFVSHQERQEADLYHRNELIKYLNKNE